MSELHLFVIWPKGRCAEKRILEDLRRETEVVFVRELSFPGDMESAYRRFYGPALPDAKRKVEHCGEGPFVLVVVRDADPKYETLDTGARRPLNCNAKMFTLKTRYREWAGRKHRVHGTLAREEFASDIEILTGHTAGEWEKGVPAGEIAPKLPAMWAAVSRTDPFAPSRIRPVFGGDTGIPVLGKVFLENKYINDVFTSGRFLAMDAVEKTSSKAVYSIGNEYKLAARMYAALPGSVPMPLGWFYSGDGKKASVVSEAVRGETLTETMAKGLPESKADVFASDMVRIAEVLAKTGIVHRDLFGDNFIVSAADGHLKVIDWQLAVERDGYREDPWVERNWKFKYVVFGVNRDLGMGNWNDFLAMSRLLSSFPQTPVVVNAKKRMDALAAGGMFSRPPRGAVKFKLRLYALSLRLQMLIKSRKSEKYAKLRRRYATIMEKGKSETEGVL